MGLLKKAIPVAAILAVIVSLLPPSTPVYADSSHTWDTKADFDAGVLTNVDTSSNPGDVVLATDLYTGNASSGDNYVNNITEYMDDRKAAVTQRCNAGSDVVHVSDTTLFDISQEILIIQMTGTGAGQWETKYIQSVVPGQITLTENLQNTYYADGNSRAQVIVIYHFGETAVLNGGKITCDPWNGSTGGIVIFRSAGTVTIGPDGSIDVSGKGLSGGGGGSGGSGGKGGDGGEGGYGTFRHPAVKGGEAGTGGTGGIHSCKDKCGDGADGARRGYMGGKGDAGSTGQGLAGGASGQGGGNGSSYDLSLLQAGSGGGGGSGGQGGYGGGGGGGGGEGDIGTGYDGAPGTKGGTGGGGGTGGQGAGAIIIFAQAITVNGNMVATGSPASRGGGGSGGQDSDYVTDQSDGGQGSLGCSGGGGGGGAGSQGGYGGNGGGGGAAGTIWLAAENLTLGNSLVTAYGGAGKNGGGGGGGGTGQYGGGGGDTLGWCEGHDGDDGSGGPGGHTGGAGGTGGTGKIRLDYSNASGITDPLPSYVTGLYYTSGTIASDVWDTGWHADMWRNLNWQRTLHHNTGISFQARASDTLFTKDNTAIPWISLGSTSPVTTGLPTGRYMQWRATLTSDHDYTPVLHSVSVNYGNAPIVTTEPATNVTASSATLNGTLTFMGASSTEAGVNFQMADTPGGPYYDVCSAQYVTALGSFQVNLPGLSPSTTYYYRSKAVSNWDGTGYGNEMVFSTSTAPPTVATNTASPVTASAAVLNGILTSRGSATTVNVSFQWGTTSGGPYPNSTTAQAMTATGAFNCNLTGLSPDTTYYFRAKADGGTSGAGYGAEKSFTTAKVPPSVTTADATSVGSYWASLNGDLASMGTAPTVNVSFQWGTTSGGPYPNSTPPQAKTAVGSFSADLGGLSGKTTYYFKAQADGGVHGVSYGAEKSFTTAIVQPSVVTIGATAVTSSSAALNGNLTSMGTASTVDVTFCYGLHPGEFNHLPWQTLNAPMGFQSILDGLAPDTTYYFRATAEGDGNNVDGAELTFHTSKAPPSVTTNGATYVHPTTATLNGTLTSLGSAPSVDVSFQYGTTSGMYSNETIAKTLSDPVDFDDNLVGLSPGTTYYYRAKANGGIHGIAYGTEHVFTTGRTPPSVTTGAANHLTTNSANLNGNLTDLGTATTVNVSFQYGTTRGGPYTNSTTPQAMTAMVAFQTPLGGLTPSTEYYYRARADGGVNGVGYGDEATFRTGMLPPYVETLSATGTTGTASTLNGDLYNLGSATAVNVFFEYGVTQGGPYPISTLPQVKAAADAFDAGLTGLTPGATYYFRAKGDGGEYGVSSGAEMSFTTSKQPPSVTTDPASDIASDSATLKGNMTNKGDAATDNVSFQWGIWQGGPYPYSTPQQSMASTGPFQAGLTGLHGDTAYYYRAKADGGIYGAAYGNECSFTTLTVPPTVETDNATAVAATSATLNGFLDSMGTAPTVNTWFAWGITHDCSNSTPVQIKDSRGFLRADLTGLTPLTTYYFRAKVNGDGTAEGSESSFTTGATPPSVSTGGATAVTADSATINGDLHSLGTATTVNVSFQYSTTSGVYGDETPQQLMNDAGPFPANLSSLHSNTTYYYRAKADGGEHGTSYGAEHVFTTSALPPEATTTAATHMTTDTARLNGNLDLLGTATAVNTSFVYGIAAGGPYPITTPPQAMTSTGAFFTYVTGMTPFTTYYYKARADGGKYGTGYGAEQSFTTNHLPPVMWTGGATDVMTNAATLNGNLYLMGSAPTVDVSFEWGTTSGDYPNETPSQLMDEREAFLADLTGLLPNTTYYFRAKGVGSNGSGTGYGAEQAFTTSSHPPIVATSDASSITDGAARLNGNLLSPGSAAAVNVSFEYGTSQGGPYPNSTPSQSRTTGGAFQADISGLSPHVAYYFRAKADGGIYGAGYGAEMSFITPSAPPLVTTADATSVTSGSAVLNGELTSLGRATMVNVSFQWGITRGGPYPNTTPPQPMNGPASYWSNLSGLSPNTTYYFMAKADGGVYGVSYGVEKSFTTVPTPIPPAPPNPLIGTGGQTSHGSSVSGTTTTTQPVPLPNIQVQSASLSVSKVSPGTPVTVTANVANRGTVNGSTMIKLYVNGEEDSIQGVTVESGGNRPVYFTVNRSQPGTYAVYVGGVQAGSFVVTEYLEPDSILFISLTLIFFSLVLGIIYVWRKRQQEY